MTQAYVTKTIEIRNAKDSTWRVQFQEYETVHEISGGVMAMIFAEIQRFKGNTGRAIDALHEAANLFEDKS